MYIRIDEGYNEHPTILKDILHIEFHRLTSLNLGNNNIVSIECVELLRMPNLKELLLCKHHITKGETTSSASEP